MARLNRSWCGLVIGIILVAGSTAHAELLVNEFAATFGTIKVNATDLKKFSLDDGMITLTLSDDVDGMSIDKVTFDLTGYAGPLGTSNPIAVVSDTLTIRLESTIAQYDVVSAQLTQILNNPIAIGFIELELTLNNSNLAVGGENVIVPSALTSAITINGLKITVEEGSGGQKNGKAQLGSVASASLTAIPEPGTCTLLGLGMLVVGLALRGRPRD